MRCACVDLMWYLSKLSIRVKILNSKIFLQKTVKFIENVLMSELERLFLLEQVGGQCSCKDRVASRDCSSCQDGYFNLQEANPVGCEPCNCNTAGTFNGDIKCHATDGQCNCKANVRSEFHARYV